MVLSSVTGGGQGQITIYRGSASGLNSQPAANRVISSGETSFHTADLNGDAIDEIFVMAFAFDGTFNANAIPSIWNYTNGKINLIPSSLQVQTLPSIGQTVEGTVQLGSIIQRISSGDFNGDGNDDILYSLKFNASQLFQVEYAVYDQVFYGNNLSSFGQSSKVLFSDSKENYSSLLLNSAQTSTAIGDVNADGFDDILVNQEFSNSLGALHLGGNGSTSLTHSIPIQGLPNRQTLYQTGQAGDINGDGYDDFLMSDLDYQLTYAIYGQDWLPQTQTWFPNGAVTVQTLEGTNGNDVLQSSPTGTNFLLSINGQNGNDYSINPIPPAAGTQAFKFEGGQGDDQIGLPATDGSYIVQIDGGTGFDTIFLQNTSGSAQSLDLTKTYRKISNIEAINLGYDDAVIFDSTSLLKVLDSHKTLLISGTNSFAELLYDPNWSQQPVGQENYNGTIYNIYSYQNSALQVWVEDGGVTWRMSDNPTTFDSAQYLASYDDLLQAFGDNLAAGLNHYETFGFFERRVSDLFDEVGYVASYPDLITAFGTDYTAATQHYISQGYEEGRSSSEFDGARYLNSYADLLAGFGTDIAAATVHYVEHGFSEGRNPNLFPSDSYLASYPDLLRAFRYNLEAGSQHYLFHGQGEGRKILFDAQAYLNRYPDLQAAFGNDLTQATYHYIEYGYFEGRSWV